MKLIDRALPDEGIKKLTSVTFKCTEPDKEKLRKLAEAYNTDLTDIMLQLINIAYKSISPKVIQDNVDGTNNK